MMFLNAVKLQNAKIIQLQDDQTGGAALDSGDSDERQ